jgi:hypothetical protein
MGLLACLLLVVSLAAAEIVLVTAEGTSRVVIGIEAEFGVPTSPSSLFSSPLIHFQTSSFSPYPLFYLLSSSSLNSLPVHNRTECLGLSGVGRACVGLRAGVRGK